MMQMLPTVISQFVRCDRPLWSTFDRQLQTDSGRIVNARTVLREAWYMVQAQAAWAVYEHRRRLLTLESRERASGEHGSLELPHSVLGAQ